MVNLNEFHEDISKRLKTVKERLGISSRMSFHAMKEAEEDLATDPVLANTLRRDVMDAFREGKTSRIIHQDLMMLQKLRTEEDKNKGSTSSTSSFQMALPSLSVLVTNFFGAHERLNRFFTPEELGVKGVEGGGISPGGPGASGATGSHDALPRTSWTLALDLTAERRGHERGASGAGAGSRLEREQREQLPVHLDKVLKALNDAVEESERHVNAGEGCLHGISIPVNYEDVGSVIAYALLSDKVKEQMAAQWSMLPGGRSCCPLESVEGLCFRSLPKVLQRPSGPWTEGHPESSEGKKTMSTGAMEETEARKKLKSKEWKWVPSAEQNKSPQDWEGLGLRDVLTGPVSKEPVKAGDAEVWCENVCPMFGCDV